MDQFVAARFSALCPLRSATCYQRPDGLSVLIMTTEKSNIKHILNTASSQATNDSIPHNKLCVLLSKLLLRTTDFSVAFFWLVFKMALHFLYFWLVICELRS